MFKHTHGNVPVSVSQLFTTNKEYHNYNTRNCAHIHAPVGTTEARYRAFGYRGIYIWNHILQQDAREAMRVVFFCTHKTYLYAQNEISYEYIQILF